MDLLKHNDVMLRSERRERLEAWAASDSGTRAGWDQVRVARTDHFLLVPGPNSSTGAASRGILSVHGVVFAIFVEVLR
jgi:hypothetical protein